MTALLAGILAFALAFAAWRWGLQNDNWLEGGIVAAVLAGLVVTVLLTLR